MIGRLYPFLKVFNIAMMAAFIFILLVLAMVESGKSNSRYDKHHRTYTVETVHVCTDSNCLVDIRSSNNDTEHDVEVEMLVRVGQTIYEQCYKKDSKTYCVDEYLNDYDDEYSATIEDIEND